MFYIITSLCGGSILIYLLITNMDYCKTMILYYYLRFMAIITILKNIYFENNSNNLYFVDNDKLKINSQTSDNKILISVNNLSNKFIESNFKFVFIEVETNNGTYNITLSTINITFYIIDNVLDYNFILWYLINIEKIKNFTIENILNVTIMDHYYKKMNLSKNDKLLIYKSGYKII
jgi:hypothetical protein|tara:strand:+ start:1040 stop:1570 length:531 start_codon:yes stop_codon:yes gene_type:complete